MSTTSRSCCRRYAANLAACQSVKSPLNARPVRERGTPLFIFLIDRFRKLVAMGRIKSIQVAFIYGTPIPTGVSSLSPSMYGRLRLYSLIQRDHTSIPLLLGFTTFVKEVFLSPARKTERRNKHCDACYINTR